MLTVTMASSTPSTPYSNYTSIFLHVAACWIESLMGMGGVGKEGEKTYITFRSSLIALHKIYEELKPRKKHLQELKKTPFWGFFEPFSRGQVDKTSVRKSDEDAIEIIKCYDPELKVFKIGEQHLHITDRDISLIFGINSGKEPVNLTYKSKPDTDFLKRRCKDNRRLTPPIIKKLLEEAMLGNEKEDFEDVARLFILFAFVTIFFATSGQELSWSFIQYVEDLNKMNEYGWAECITRTLMASIEKYFKDPKRVTGCVTTLQYWICEHSTIIKPQKADAKPRFMKWNLWTLAKEMKKISLENREKEKVLVNELTPTEDEQLFLPYYFIEEQISEAKGSTLVVFQQEEDQQEEADDQEKSNRDEFENEELEGIDALMNLPLISQIEEQKRQEKEESHLKKEIEEKNAQIKKLESERDDFATTIQQQQSEIEILKKQVEDLKETNKNQEIDFEEKLKAYDVVVADSEEKIAELTKQNKELMDKIDDNETHRVTQQLKSLKEDTQSSMIRNLKGKQRKNVQLSDYTYEKAKEGKKRGRKTLQEDLPTFQLIDSQEDAEPTTKKPNKKVSFPEMAKVTLLLSEKDREILRKIYKTEMHEAIIWTGNETGSAIFFEDIQSLLTEGDTSNNLIDSHAELLERELEDRRKNNTLPKAADTPKSFFFSSTCWTFVEVGNLQGIKNLLENKIIEATEKGCQLYLFPMNTNGYKKGIANHWTLLVYDNQTDEWKHYNSLHPRKGHKDPYFLEAITMKNFVEKIRQRIIKGDKGPIDQTNQNIFQASDCPQQKSGSLDCGIIVCYAMRQLALGLELDAKLPADKVRILRKNLIHKYLNDKGRSWTEESLQTRMALGN